MKKEKKIKPKYRCVRCEKFFHRPIPGPTSCPYCGNLYVEWLNFEEVLESLLKDRRSKTLEEVWTKGR